MHRKRLFSRKYNQAALLACNISKLTGVPFLANAFLLKKRHDIPQTHLNRDDRLKNVRGSFVAAPGAIQQLQGKDLILVDDVYTTGTTLNECSKVLKKAGCASVHAVTLAKVVNVSLMDTFSLRSHYSCAFCGFNAELQCSIIDSKISIWAIKVAQNRSVFC